MSGSSMSLARLPTLPDSCCRVHEGLSLQRPRGLRRPRRRTPREPLRAFRPRAANRSETVPTSSPFLPLGARSFGPATRPCPRVRLCSASHCSGLHRDVRVDWSPRTQDSAPPCGVVNWYRGFMAIGGGSIGRSLEGPREADGGRCTSCEARRTAELTAHQRVESAPTSMRSTSRWQR